MGLLNDFNKTVSTVSRTATNVKRVIRTVDGVGDALSKTVKKDSGKTSQKKSSSKSSSSKSSSKTQTKKAEEAKTETKAAESPAPRNMGPKQVVFWNLPKTIDDFRSLPQASLSSPNESAAMALLALSYYGKDPLLSMSMLEFVKGPAELGDHEKSMLADALSKDPTLIRSFFRGASASNGYEPDDPYTVVLGNASEADDTDVYATVEIQGSRESGEVRLRKTRDGRWCLWEQFLLDVASDDSPWA